MRDTLATEVEDFLRVHGASTATEISLGVRARRDDVDEVLATETFKRVKAPDGCSPRASYFNLSYLVPVVGKTVVNRAERMLSVLKDGRPHTRQEIFERVGFMLTNNAASELRRDGHTIHQHRERGNIVYQLVGAEHRSGVLNADDEPRELSPIAFEWRNSKPIGDDVA